jgi:TIR domain
MAHDVFISYSKENKALADGVVARLEGANIRCWIAPRDIVGGSDWNESIMTAIESCRALVLVFTTYANASPQVRREVQAAFERGRVVIPVRADDVQPAGGLAYYLEGVHWLDAITPPWESHLAAVVSTVQTVLGSRADSPAPVDPVKPKSPLKAAGRPGAVGIGVRKKVAWAAAAVVAVILGVLALVWILPGATDAETSLVGRWQQQAFDPVNDQWIASGEYQVLITSQELSMATVDTTSIGPGRERPQKISNVQFDGETWSFQSTLEGVSATFRLKKVDDNTFEGYAEIDGEPVEKNRWSRRSRLQ